MNAQARSDGGAGRGTWMLLVLIFAVATVAATWKSPVEGGDISAAADAGSKNHQDYRGLVGIAVKTDLKTEIARFGIHRVERIGPA